MRIKRLHVETLRNRKLSCEYFLVFVTILIAKNRFDVIHERKNTVSTDTLHIAFIKKIKKTHRKKKRNNVKYTFI